MKKKKSTEKEFNNPAKSSPNVKEIKEEKKPQRKAEKKAKRMKRNSVIFVTLHGILSGIFLISVLALGVLPFSYLAAVFAIVVLLFVVAWWSQKRKKAGRIIGRIYSTVIMLVLLLGSFCMGVANHVLNQITDAPYEVKEEKTNFLSLDSVFSITEDSFCVYVEDINRKAEVEDAQIFLSVNLKTHQILEVTTPGACFVTIPNISKGQKEYLANVGEYGIEATISAMENLYETKIPYYLKVDMQWLNAMKSGGFSLDTVKELYDGIVNIDKYVQTNMKKGELRELIKMRIQDFTDLEIQTYVVDGIEGKSYTFTSPDDMVKGIVPNPNKVEEVIQWIDKMEEDEVLKKSNPIILK